MINATNNSFVGHYICQHQTYMAFFGSLRALLLQKAENGIRNVCRARIKIIFKPFYYTCILRCDDAVRVGAIHRRNRARYR